MSRSRKKDRLPEDRNRRQGNRAVKTPSSPVTSGDSDAPSASAPPAAIASLAGPFAVSSCWRLPRSSARPSLTNSSISTIPTTSTGTLA